MVSFPTQRASYYNLALTHIYTVTYQWQSAHMLSHTTDTAQGNSDTKTAGGRDELKRREKIAFLKTMWGFFCFFFFTPTQVRAAATKDWGLTKGELSSFNTIKSKTITSLFNTNSYQYLINSSE